MKLKLRLKLVILVGCIVGLSSFSKAQVLPNQVESATAPAAAESTVRKEALAKLAGIQVLNLDYIHRNLTINISHHAFVMAFVNNGLYVGTERYPDIDPASPIFVTIINNKFYFSVTGPDVMSYRYIILNNSDPRVHKMIVDVLEPLGLLEAFFETQYR